MGISRDCGDVEITVGLTIGTRFIPPLPREEMQRIENRLNEIGDELRMKRERMEVELLDFVCDKLGLTEEVVREKLASRDNTQRELIEAENAGRAEKHRRRQQR